MNNNVFYYKLISFFRFRIRENVKKVSMSDLKDFLENIRRLSSKIGEVAMRHVSFRFPISSLDCLGKAGYS